MTTLEGVAMKPTGRSLELWRAVLSLAEPVEPPEIAALRPPIPGFAENLVLKFDEAYTSFVEGFEELPSEGQMLALQAVDIQLAAMVAEKDAGLWTDLARREDIHWIEVRSLAARVLSEFGWPSTHG
jgi:hypothetical protein